MSHEVSIELFTVLLAHTLVHSRVHLDRDGNVCSLGREN